MQRSVDEVQETVTRVQEAAGRINSAQATSGMDDGHFAATPPKSRFFYLSGHVERPGAYALPPAVGPKLTLLQVLAAAAGTDGVLVPDNFEVELVSAEGERTTFTGDAVVNGDAGQRTLRPGDLVVVRAVEADTIDTQPEPDGDQP